MIGEDIPIGQAPQALAYVPNAVPDGAGTVNLQPLVGAGHATHLTLAGKGGGAPTSVSLFNQGLVQVVQASVTGLVPGTTYVLGLSEHPDGGVPIESLAAFKTNPAGSAIVGVVGPIRQLVEDDRPAARRYLVVAPQVHGVVGAPVQVQTAER